MHHFFCYFQNTDYPVFNNMVHHKSFIENKNHNLLCSFWYIEIRWHSQLYHIFSALIKQQDLIWWKNWWRKKSHYHENNPMLICQEQQWNQLSSLCTKCEIQMIEREIFEYCTAWKVFVFGVSLVCIFPHSDWIRRDAPYTPYLSVFSPNVGKYAPGKLRIRTLFSQCSATNLKRKSHFVKYRSSTYFPGV